MNRRPGFRRWNTFVPGDLVRVPRVYRAWRSNTKLAPKVGQIITVNPRQIATVLCTHNSFVTVTVNGQLCDIALDTLVKC